ncbi:MAG TPA: hypothetical protein GX505_05220 [Clostridiales bacterium]|nr:hypothetical protein [Clostridiales bacterium]
MLGIFKKKQTGSKQAPEAQEANIDQSSYQIVEVTESGSDNAQDQDELIAVITAAIAASLNRSTHSVVVRSIRQVPTTSPAWNRAARFDLTASRL